MDASYLPSWSHVFNTAVKNDVEKIVVTFVIARNAARFNALHWMRCEH